MVCLKRHAKCGSACSPFRPLSQRAGGMSNVAEGAARAAKTGANQIPEFSASSAVRVVHPDQCTDVRHRWGTAHSLVLNVSKPIAAGVDLADRMRQQPAWTPQVQRVNRNTLRHYRIRTFEGVTTVAGPSQDRCAAPLKSPVKPEGTELVSHSSCCRHISDRSQL